MRKLLVISAAVLLISSLFSGCLGEFETVRKGDDFELKYQKGLEYYENEEWYKAQQLLEQILPIYRGSDKIEKIYYSYADTYFQMERFVLASYYFKNFTTTFPNSDLAEEASFMSAYSNYKLSPNHRLDQTYTEDAVNDFQIFVNTYPNSPKVSEVNQLIDDMRDKMEEKAFAEADLYFKLNDYKSANHTYKNVIKVYPDAEKVEHARFMVIKSSYRLAINSIDFIKEDRFNETIKAYNDFLEKHPNSSKKNEADQLYQASLDKIEKLNQ